MPIEKVENVVKYADALKATGDVAWLLSEDTYAAEAGFGLDTLLT
jgi:hypothetical protein